jgi:hypothetical protein
LRSTVRLGCVIEIQAEEVQGTLALTFLLALGAWGLIIWEARPVEDVIATAQYQLAI